MAALKKLHPDAINAPSPSWVATLVADDNDQRHEIFVEIARKSPAFAIGRLSSMGLLQPALRLLLSNSKEARSFAVDLARAHASEIAPDVLVAFAGRARHKEVLDLVREIVAARRPRDLGPALLVKMLEFGALRGFAEKALLEQFTMAELGDALIIDLAYDAGVGHAV